MWGKKNAENPPGELRPLNESEIQHAHEMVRQIATGEARGYFTIIKLLGEDPKGRGMEVDGMLKMSDVSNAIVMSSTAESLQLTGDDVRRLLLKGVFDSR